MEFLNADTAYNSVFLTDISCAYKFDKNPFDSALANDIIYKATVTTSNTNTIKHYIDMVATAMNLSLTKNTQLTIRNLEVYLKIKNKTPTFPTANI